MTSNNLERKEMRLDSIGDEDDWVKKKRSAVNY